MEHPTAKRLAYLANLTETDLATDLSCLLALAIDVDYALTGRPRPIYRNQDESAVWRPLGIQAR